MRSALSATAAITVTLALVTSGAAASYAADGSVSGFVFRDFGSDGSYNTGNPPGSGLPNDVPLGSVIVTAFDRANTVVGTTTSLPDGTYTLPVAGAATTALRVEFSFPANLTAEGYESSYHGTQSGTSVQFTTIGATSIDFAANVPEDYIGSNPRVGITAQRPGDPLLGTYPELGAGWATDPDLYSSVVTIDYESDSDNAADPVAEATANGKDAHGIATGSLYGIVAPRGTETFYASASLRRHTGLGAAGLGAIYTVDASTHVASLLIDLDNGAAGGGIDVGEASFSTALGSAGSADDNAARGLVANPVTPTHDEKAWPLVGKVGIGGMAISADDETLYAINLYNRTLLVIDIATLTVQEVALDSLGADDRPYGVAVHHGQVYVGIVNSAESATGDAATRRASVSARVISTPEAASSSPTWSTALTIDDFTWARGGASNGGFGTPNWSTDDVATHWNAWSDDPAAATQTVHGGSGITWTTNAQPLISSMSFDSNGTIAIGFLDRYTFQTGMNNYSIDTSSTALYSGIASGGILAASANGDGTFTLENNGVVAGVTGAGANNGHGPGGGQYYPQNRGAHSNVFTGAVAIAPGFSTMLATGYDITGQWTSDAGWLPTDGTELTLAQRVINNAQDNNDPDTLTPGVGKAGGLGGVTLLADAAPVEIGNRTWYDADLDGVQDADEPAVPGVTVTLTDADGNPVVDAAGVPVAATTTNADGLYYFSNLIPRTDYLVRFDYSTADVSGLTSAFGITSPSQLQFTQQFATAAGGTPVNDSNPDPATGVAKVSVGLAGQNDHTIDAGLIAYVYLDVTKRVEGNAPAGAVYEITLECRDFRDEALDPATLTLEVKAGETVSEEFAAGTTCIIDEPDNLGATSTSFVVNGGDAQAETGQVRIEGTPAAPTTVVVTNTFPPPPVVPPVVPPVTPTPEPTKPLASTGFDSSLLVPFSVLLLALGGLAVGVTRVRRGAK